MVDFFGIQPKESRSQSKPKKEGMNGEDIAWIIILAGLLIGLATYSMDFKKLEFQYFDYIYFGPYVVLAVLLAALGVFLTYKTGDLTERVKVLKPLWSKGAGILVGKTQDSGVNLYIPDEARLGHVQILGATGRGKTESVIIPWVVRDLKRGRSPVLVDGKGDPTLVAQIEAAIEQDEASFSRDLKYEIIVFDLGNLEKSATTNPLLHGSPQQITDRIFTAFQFQDEFYRAVQYDITRALISLIQEVDAKDGKSGVVTFKRLYELLTDPAALDQALAKSQTGRRSPKGSQKARLSGVQREENRGRRRARTHDRLALSFDGRTNTRMSEARQSVALE